MNDLRASAMAGAFIVSRLAKRMGVNRTAKGFYSRQFYASLHLRRGKMAFGKYTTKIPTVGARDVVHTSQFNGKQEGEPNWQA
jgi:hypothetical protein